MTTPSLISIPELERPRSGSLEARASIALILLAALQAAGLAIGLLPGATPGASLASAAWGLASGAVAILYLAEALALGRRRPWAVAAVRSLLLVVLAAGVVIVLEAYGQGHLRLPFEVVIAIWPWLGAADVHPTPGHDPRSVSLVGAVVGLLAVVLFVQPVFGWGGFLDVRQADLRASLVADCGPPGSGPPATVTVSYDWSWAATSPFPSGLDVVVIGWTGTDSAGRPLYLVGDTPDLGNGIYSGLQDDPSLDLALQAESESGGSWHWGIQLSEEQLRPGHIDLPLERAREAPPGPKPLTITATYIHVGLWRQDAASVTCSW